MTRSGSWVVGEKSTRKSLTMKFEIHRASGGQYYWRIVASNGQVLATSETYYNKIDAQTAAESVRSQAGSAQIFDYA